MIVEKILNVSSQQFFNEIQKSILYDIKNATGNDIENIENGLTYSKILHTKLSSASHVEIKILEYTYPEVYTAEFKTSKSLSTIKYSAFAMNDNQCKVTYAENIEYFKKMDDWNFRLVSKFYSAKSRKKILMLLGNIEQSILNISE